MALGETNGPLLLPVKFGARSIYSIPPVARLGSSKPWRWKARWTPPLFDRLLAAFPERATEIEPVARQRLPGNAAAEFVQAGRMAPTPWATPGNGTWVLSPLSSGDASKTESSEGRGEIASIKSVPLVCPAAMAVLPRVCRIDGEPTEIAPSCSSGEDCSFLLSSCFHLLPPRGRMGAREPQRGGIDGDSPWLNL